MTPEYESLLALKKYLSPDAAAKLTTMIKNKEPVDDINMFVNREITVKQIRGTKLLAAEEAMMEYKSYEDKLNDEEKLLVKKFYYELYGNAIYNVPEDFRLLKTKEMIKESNRNRNMKRTDMFDVAEKRHLMDSLERHERELEKDEAGGGDWESVYNYFGYEPALNFLIEACEDELKIKTLDIRLTLIRFYINMDKLRIVNNKNLRIKT